MITNKNNNYKGFTLVEIMVSLVISSILMLGVIQVFSNSKRNSKVNEAVSRVQENARFAMESMITDFRKAGYAGCNSEDLTSYVDTSGGGADDLFNINSGTGGWEYTASDTTPATTIGSPYVIPATFTVTEAVTSWDNNADNDIPATLLNQVAPGSDIIVVKWAQPILGLTGAKNNNSSSKSVQTTAAHQVPQGGIAILTDCTGGDVFVNTAAADNQLARGTASGWDPGNIAAPAGWSQAWNDNTQMMGIVSRAYFVGEGAGGGPALIRASFSDASTVILEELVEGIENIQVLYGVDTDDDGVINTYNTANNVSHAQVVSLKIGIIVASDAESLSTAKARTLNVIGTYVKTPNDRRLRYVFNSTTKLRNKGVK